MTSESTRFLGQPRETKPILGRGVDDAAAEVSVGWVASMAEGVTTFSLPVFSGISYLNGFAEGAHCPQTAIHFQQNAERNGRYGPAMIAMV